MIIHVLYVIFMKSFNKTFSNFRNLNKPKNSPALVRKSMHESIDPVQSNNPVNASFRSTLRSSNNQQQNAYKAALVYDNSEDQRILYEKCGNERRQIASLTKIMTCLVTLMYIQENQLKPERQRFIVSKEAASLKGTTANLEYGDQITIWDLLYGLMLPSGNDAAFCLAEGVGKKIVEGEWRKQKQEKIVEKSKAQKKSIHFKNNKNFYVEAFVNEMNKVSQRYKMRDTRYSNPHGLADQTNYSTVQDQLVLIQKCLQRPYFEKIVKTKLYFSMVEEACQSNWTREMLWQNTNRLLYRGYEGIKTGNTIPAGYCLASWYKDKNTNLIIIVLGTSSREERDNQTIRLTKLAMNSFLKEKTEK